MKLGILISGRGSNMDNILEAIKIGDLKAEVLFVLSNKEDALGLKIAKNRGVTTICLPKFRFDDMTYETSREKYEEDLYELIKGYEIDYICLAGLMHILGEKFIFRYPNKIVNMHPSLLPSFKGAKGAQEAFEYGVRIAGCTLHFVIPEIDSGDIISQSAITLENCSSKEELSEKILKAEHLTYLYGLKKLCGEDETQLNKLRQKAYENRILLY